MIFRRYDRNHRFGAVFVACMVLVLVLSGVLPALAAVGLLTFEAVPGTRAGEVIVRWETATETNVVGFRVMRSIQPLVQTGTVITTMPSTGSTTSGAVYEVIDPGLTPGQIYYYWLLELTNSGQQNVLTQGIQALAPGNPLATRHYYFPVMRRSP